MLLSTIIGKKIVNISTALDLGGVTGFTYHKGSIEYFVTDDCMAIKVTDIIAISDVITVNMHYNFAELKYPLLNITNVYICSMQGKHLGNLQDVLVDERYAIKRLITDLKNIIQFRIASYSSTTLVLDKQCKEDIPKKETEICIPTVITNYDFLINRTLFRNILSSSGSLLFKRGQLITKLDIDKARNIGKLVQLTLYSTPLK